MRFDIEASFHDAKSGGFQLHTSRLVSPDALERLLLVLAIATLYLTSLGTWVIQTAKRRWVDPHWQRGLSYLKWEAEGFACKCSAEGLLLPRFGLIPHQTPSQC